MCMRDAIYSSGGAVILMMALRLPLFCARARARACRAVVLWIEWGCQNFYGKRKSVVNTGNTVAVRDAISGQVPGGRTDGSTCTSHDDKRAPHACAP